VGGKYPSGRFLALNWCGIVARVLLYLTQAAYLKGVITVGITRTSVRPVVLAGVGSPDKEGRRRKTLSK